MAYKLIKRKYAIQLNREGVIVCFKHGRGCIFFINRTRIEFKVLLSTIEKSLGQRGCDSQVLYSPHDRFPRRRN